MKQTARFLLAAILFTSVSCSDNKADVKGVTADKETSKALAADNKAQQHKATVKAFYDAMNMHDLKAASTHLAPGYKEYADNVTEPAASDSSANLIRDWLTAFPDFKSDTKEIVADDNVVMIWSDQSATWKGYFMGQKPTGKSYKVQDVDIFYFNEEGKISEHHSIQPTAAIANQIGLSMK